MNSTHEGKRASTIEADIAEIRTVLDKARNANQTSRYGGTYDKWLQVLGAIEALDRIERDLNQRQMKLL